MTEIIENGHIDADIFGASDAGAVRQSNEDRFVSERIDNTDFIVAAAIDGMGSYAGGEYAADLTERTVSNFLNMAMPTANPGKALFQAFVNANNRIVEHREADPTMGRMACVAVGALFSLGERKVYMVNCGDSRLYRYSGGVLTKLSHDHSPVGRLEDAHEISEAEAMTHPKRNIVDRCLGLQTLTSDSLDFLEAASFDIEDGESTYLLCSDGVSNMLTSEQISEILAVDCPAEETAAALIEKANAAGGRDNVTAVVVKLNASSGQAASEASTTESSEAKPRRRIKLPRIPRTTIIAAAWVIFLAALIAIVVLGVHRFTHEVYPENGEEMTEDSSTVFVMVDNELDSVKVDTLSKVVMQARDSARVDIPRGK